MDKDERQVFGIPYPLTLATLLSAFEKTVFDVYTRRVRQREAFRERILRMFAEKDAEIAERRRLSAGLGIEIHEWAEKHYEAKQQLAAKDERICNLQARIAELERKLDLEMRINLPEGEDD